MHNILSHIYLNIFCLRLLPYSITKKIINHLTIDFKINNFKYYYFNFNNLIIIYIKYYLPFTF